MTHDADFRGLFVTDGGFGRTPVVIVHSAAGSSAQWANQLEHLRRERRAVALDLRGHGRSSAPSSGEYSMAGFVSDVETVVDELGLERFVVAGHSLGGAVGLAYAAQHPERVAGLLLMDPASDGRAIPPEERAGLMAALRSPAYEATVDAYYRSLLGASSSQVRERVLEDARRTPAEAVIGTLEALLDFDPVTALERYRGPRLSVITPLNEIPNAYHRLVTDLPHRSVSGVGHWFQLDRPDLANAAFDEFLAQVEAALAGSGTGPAGGIVSQPSER